MVASELAAARSPFIVWCFYAYEGWYPYAVKTAEEAYRMADKHDGEAIVTPTAVMWKEGEGKPVKS